MALVKHIIRVSLYFSVGYLLVLVGQLIVLRTFDVDAMFLWPLGALAGGWASLYILMRRKRRRGFIKSLGDNLISSGDAYHDWHQLYYASFWSHKLLMFLVALHALLAALATALVMPEILLLQ